MQWFLISKKINNLFVVIYFSGFKNINEELKRVNEDLKNKSKNSKNLKEKKKINNKKRRWWKNNKLEKWKEFIEKENIILK